MFDSLIAYAADTAGPSVEQDNPSDADDVRALIGTYLESRQQIIEKVMRLPRINVWSAVIPELSAAYVVWDGAIVRYTGATANLRQRFYKHRTVRKNWPDYSLPPPSPGWDRRNG